MPVFNESAYIERSLGALLGQTYPADRMEIVIADGMSSDNTRELIAEMARGTTVPIKVVDNPDQIAPSGLNRAIAETSGEIVIRVDGHCEIEPEYTSNCVALLEAGKADGVGGPIETIGETTRAQAIAMAMGSKFGVGGSAFRTVDDREMFVDTVAFPAYTREILNRAGAFNEELVRNQDDEYNYRIRKLGGKILLSPTIRSRYYSRSSLRSLWRQYFQYGYWKVRVMQMHPAQMSVRQFIPFAFVSSLLLMAVLSLVTGAALWGLAAVLISYLIANLAAAVLTARTNIAAMPLLSLSFAILHFSYGLGFLRGLFAFAGNWRTTPAKEPVPDS
jgi:succinoglycan biosynthesis protein ExoA